MPTLNWIGKEKVLTHHNDVPFRVLERKYTFGDTPDSGNMIIHGDNLEALKALLPEYKNRINCIYIDPPYNTGNENWVYNDNVNDPHIRKWLGKVVGSEVDDLTRHDKWLCMMYPRLVLLQRLLKEDGAIFISIDDNEQADLKMICDDIFGKTNFVGTFTWKCRAKPSNTGSAKYKPQNDSEFIFCYKGLGVPHFLCVSSGKERSYPHSDKDGNYRLQTILKSNRGENKRETMTFSLNGYTPPPTKRWQAGEDTIKDLFEKNRITFETGEPMLKYYQHEENDEVSPFWCHLSSEISNTSETGKNTLNQILGNTHGFDTVKPVTLIEYLLFHTATKDSIILDSFAGSGSTAHAVMNLNKKDGGNRKYILVEMMDYAETITANRIRRVITGYEYKGKEEEEIYNEKLTSKSLLKGEYLLEQAEIAIEKNKERFDKISRPTIKDNCLKVIGTKYFDDHMEGLGGSFDFYELGETIFDPATGNLNDNVDTEQIRRYVWFSETNTAYTKLDKEAHPYLLGTYQHNNYYFYYSKDEETCLDWEFLDTLNKKEKAEMYIIYADRCVLTEEEMLRLNIRFKKIPRDLKRV